MASAANTGHSARDERDCSKGSTSSCRRRDRLESSIIEVTFVADQGPGNCGFDAVDRATGISTAKREDMERTQSVGMAMLPGVEIKCSKATRCERDLCPWCECEVAVALGRVK